MDFFEGIRPAWNLTRQNKSAIHAFFLYFLILIVGLVLVAAFGLFAAQKADRSIGLLYAAILLGAVWFLFLFLGELFLKSAVILNAGTSRPFFQSLNEVVSRFVPLAGLGAVVGVASLLVTLSFVLLKTAAPAASIPLDVLQTLANAVLGIVFAYSLFYCVLRKTSLLDSLLKSARLFSEKPWEVIFSVLAVGFLSLIALIGIVLWVLVIAAMVGVVLLVSAGKFWGLAISVLMAMAAALVVLYLVSVLSVWSTVLLKQFFEKLDSLSSPQIPSKKPKPSPYSRKTAALPGPLQTISSFRDKPPRSSHREIGKRRKQTHDRKMA
ncbi:MAG TPA: hypothetical protein VI874_03610 [Candidatus Norongarragalinales archaeon]|nr:hypothetical protein [Candidatus Norongarragalinales archaeon]